MTPPVILTYHALGDFPRAEDPYQLFLSPRAFEEQVAHLAAHRRPVSLEDALSDGAEAPSVAITFDDGYRSVLTVAAPILAHHGVPATVFVPTMWIGAANGWDLAAATDGLAIMSAAELAELADYGITV
jgi:peptidoglycan/xylan/chitin deacetylase (PgdA/CDA1 family)